MLGYVSDDERPRSPGLQAVTVKYTPPASPPPFVPRRRPMSEPESEGQQASRKRGRGSHGRRVRPSQGEVNLLRQLAPDRPDIAALAGKQTFLPSDSASERGEIVDDDEDSRMDEAEDQALTEARSIQQGASQSRFLGDLRFSNATQRPIAGDDSLSSETDAGMPDAPSVAAIRRPAEHHDVFLGAVHSAVTARKIGVTSDRSDSSLHQPHGSCSPRDETDNGDTRDFCHLKSKSPIYLPPLSESISASPKLAPPIMAASQLSPSSAEHAHCTPLPSLHTQEPSLPSVQHLVRVAETQDEAYLHQRPRTASLSSVSSVFAPSASTYSTTTVGSGTHTRSLGPAISQPPLPPLVPLGRTATDPTPLPLPNPSGLRHASTNPAEFAMHSTANTSFTHPPHAAPSNGSTSTPGATPGSLHDAPTPSDRSSSTLSLPVSPERSTHALANSQVSIGGSTTLYRCTHPGCRAPPFQTPYLLNSHRNVHSSDRPYFCPRKECPRSQPGRGFKRKNEMLRHGLVHDSPGYVCPFCSPEKEHRYPRPDNLQRHVKMHHEDIDPEDPRLREVLGQRRATIASTAGSSTMGSSSRRPTLPTVADTEEQGRENKAGANSGSASGACGAVTVGKGKELAIDGIQGPESSATTPRKQKRKGAGGSSGL